MQDNPAKEMLKLTNIIMYLTENTEWIYIVITSLDRSVVITVKFGDACIGELGLTLPPQPEA